MRGTCWAPAMPTAASRPAQASTAPGSSVTSMPTSASPSPTRATPSSGVAGASPAGPSSPATSSSSTGSAMSASTSATIISSTHRTPARTFVSRRSQAGTATASTALAGSAPRSRGSPSCDTGGVATTAALAGLTQHEAERKLAARPAAATRSSRSYKSIVVANVLTVFNLILLAAGVATLAFGQVQDALFLAILVANSGIGIAQEVRAKRTLDRLAALVAPTATVIRDGKPRRVGVDEVVEDDVVLLEPGDQVVADGTLRRSDGLALDESILTGESAPVSRGDGDEVRSGSFAVEGAGAYDVTAVGERSYAVRLAGQARAFRHPRSPLERAINRLLFVLVAVLVPLAVALGWALYRRHTSLHDAVPTTVAAVVTLVPEGLILLASVTYAVAAIRMARRGALAQQLNAIESLASVDTILLDKTGTLTEARLRVEALVPASGVDEGELLHELGRYAASAPARNPTLDAILDYCGGVPEEPRASVPFSSRRRWSALQLGPTTYVLGAPELFPPDELRSPADQEARAGRRVVAFGVARGPLTADSSPVIEAPLGIVVLGERLRGDARATVE